MNPDYDLASMLCTLDLDAPVFHCYEGELNYYKREMETVVTIYNEDFMEYVATSARNDRRMLFPTFFDFGMDAAQRTIDQQFYYFLAEPSARSFLQDNYFDVAEWTSICNSECVFSSPPFMYDVEHETARLLAESVGCSEYCLRFLVFPKLSRIHCVFANPQVLSQFFIKRIL
jgi:hypothetical protein